MMTVLPRPPPQGSPPLHKYVVERRIRLQDGWRTVAEPDEDDTQFVYSELKATLPSPPRLCRSPRLSTLRPSLTQLLPSSLRMDNTSSALSHGAWLAGRATGSATPAASTPMCVQRGRGDPSMRSSQTPPTQ